MKVSRQTFDRALINAENNKPDALLILRDLDHKTKTEKYKGVPPAYIPHTRFEDRTANGLTNCICVWLNLNNCYATRINTTGRQLPATKIIDVLGRAHVSPGKWIPGTTRRGTADIHAVIAGTHCSIEVKIGRDKMSEAQRQTRDDVERAGGLYFVARDFDSFLKFYNEQIVKP